ncbi:hypothetical protein KBX37_24460 [Micromonospora sp. U56]|uniref:hypothetical protein n=1 Tax=Micromonospora sp. U56 TaxID=2824900 RepID=UPI001B384FD0|nr:hypothetical protein [Micromonospora sp. U56]MBQ0896208.1 hypothetical protein [Micromonospora sp. U56]
MIRLRLYKARERQRVIDTADLEAVYVAVDPETKPVFEHDGVMVWVSEPDRCRVERRIRGRNLHLVESGTNVLPRARGLEILRRPGADYRWVHSLDWRSGAGEYLDRDRVEAIIDRALDIEPWAVPEGPVGLVHLSYLMWFHNGAMANGAAWPLNSCTTEQIAAFAAAATYFELDEIADLIGRLEPDDALSHEYWKLSSPFSEDASLIRDALRCKLVEAPADWA